jgi:hypothetical protein
MCHKFLMELRDLKPRCFRGAFYGVSNVAVSSEQAKSGKETTAACSDVPGLNLSEGTKTLCKMNQ